MESLFGRKRWARQSEDKAAARKSVDITDDSPGAFAMSAPTITPVASRATPINYDARTSMDQYRPSASKVTVAHRSSSGSDVAALRHSLMSRLPELRNSRPSDREVEVMFTDLMSRRDMLHGPSAPSPEAVNSMFEFTPDKKWTLVYNDLLTIQSAERERQRRFPTPSTSSAGAQATSMVLVRNSPEWFIKKFMDQTVTTKHIESLAVTLRTCAIGWLQSFVEAKGTHVLSNFLAALHSNPSPTEQDLAQEYEVLKAFRSLFNSKPGAYDALHHQKCINGITRSLVSPQLPTRKQAADILLFLCHWEKPQGHRLVLQGIDELKDTMKLPGRFDAWFGALETAIDGRGRMGSLVGASEEIRKLQLTALPEASLPEYVVNNMFLVNALVNSDIVDSLKTRVHLRSQMTASGLPRIMAKMRDLGTSDLNVQLQVFERGAAADNEDLMFTFQKEASRDLSNPAEVFHLVMDRVKDTRAKDFFMSAMQHLLLIQPDGNDMVHYFKLIDSMISTVVMDKDGTATAGDMSSLMGTSVNNVLERFADQDLMERLQKELKEARYSLTVRENELKSLRQRLDGTAGGLVGQLESQLKELQNDLQISRDNAAALQRDMDEMERSYVDRILGLELELRESSSLLRQAEEIKKANPEFTQFNRQVVRESLERQVERTRTIRKLMANSDEKVKLLDTSLPSQDALKTLPPQQSLLAVSTSSPTSNHDAQERIGRTAMGLSASADPSPASESVATFPTQEQEKSSEGDLQAMLASTMANDSDICERMHNVRASRLRRRDIPQENEGASLFNATPRKSQEPSSTQVAHSASATEEFATPTQKPQRSEVQYSPSHTPRPPASQLDSTETKTWQGKPNDLELSDIPFIATKSPLRATFPPSQAPIPSSDHENTSHVPPTPIPIQAVDPPGLDASGVLKKPSDASLSPPHQPSGLTGLQQPESNEGPPPPSPPPPPPPPPPPAPPVETNSGSRRVNDGIFSAPTPPQNGDTMQLLPPPPPPPPGMPENNTILAALKQKIAEKEKTSDTNASDGTGETRSSLLNVRASFQSDLGPPGPIHAPPAPSSSLPVSSNMRKNVLDMAKTRMKQLQWDKLSAEHASSTVWGKASKTEMLLRDAILQYGLFGEMEEEFKAKESSKKLHTVKKDNKELQTHLNYATRQGIEMVLKRLKSRLTDSKQCTPEELAHLIVQCDPQVFDQSILTELLRYYPESETKGRLGEYKNASDEQLRLLHPADRLVVLLMTVPHLKDKVKGMLYKTKYQDTVDLIQNGLNKIRDGAEAIMDAPNFAQLLSVVLLLGNYLNATGIKGGAYGFKISSINKLVDTKAADGTTLLHFVERTVSSRFPELEGFIDEISLATEACRVQLLDLKHDLAELKSANVQHKKDLDRLLAENEENMMDPYTKLMLPFLNTATSELQRLTDQTQHTERVFNDALRYYGEGPDPLRRSFTGGKSMPTEEFFGIFKEFLTAYRKAKTDNASLAQQRALEAARRAAAEEREKEIKEARARREAGIDDSAVLESLLTSLRSSGGTPRQKRKQRRRTRPSTSDLRAVSEAETEEPMDHPSTKAAEMLAQLQGGEKREHPSGLTAVALATVAAREDRRRERRERNSLPVLQDIPRPPSSRASSRTDTLEQSTKSSDMDSSMEHTPTSPDIHSRYITKTPPLQTRQNDAPSLNISPTSGSRRSPDSLYLTPDGHRRGSQATSSNADSPLQATTADEFDGDDLAI